MCTKEDMKSLRQITREMVKAVGLDDVCEALILSADAADNRLNGRNGQGFTTHQQLKIQKMAGSTHYADYVAFESGGAFVKFPDATVADDESLSEKFMELHAHIGELSQTYFEATRDGKITPDEKAKLELLRSKVIKLMHEWMALSFLIYCPR